jgi:malate dehydrogenase (oxaloacetate-decarboxylating)(NADP+)
MNPSDVRTETDSLGEVDVQADKLWGAQTQRSLEHFSIGKDLMPREMITAYAILKKGAAIANHAGDRLDDRRFQLITKVCDEILTGQHHDMFPLHVWMTGSGTQFNMNVNEVISNRCSQLSGTALGSKRPVHPNDHVNMSQSSNDTFPSAMNIAAAVAVENRLIPSLEALRDAIVAKAGEWKDIVKIGRTHMQDATPITLGQEWSGYAGMLSDDVERVKDALKGLYSLALGGTAVGTGINAAPGFGEAAAAEIAKLTGLPFVSAPNKFAVQGTHDALVHLSGSLRTLAVSLYKIANDIRLMSCGPRAGFAELTIPANEPGSSIMPGKVNPTQAEALTMIAAQVMANDVAVGFGGAGGYLEMNVYKPLLIYNITHSVTIITDGCTNFRKFLVEGTKPNLKKIKEYVNSSLMLVTSLSPVIGYDKASRIAHYALDNDLTLKQAALKLGFVTEAEFDRIVDPAKMVQPYVAKSEPGSIASIRHQHTNIESTIERDAKNTMTNNKVGIDLLRDPALNKSTAFTEAEKKMLGIEGLVPDVTETEDLQLSRVMMQLGHKSTDLDRYIYLNNLLDHSETLFYRTVMSDPARFLPIVYDPTIGEACLKYGHIYRQPRGMYLSINRRGHVKEILKNWPQEDVRFICVTDSGRILGLGDLGANGAPIPIGKLQLYTACAGVPPQYLLPMYLDAGTNNEQYLHDPLYLGLRKTRPSTEELYSFVDEFVQAVQEVFPKCCIHFEDWTGVDAVHLLQRYRDKYCVYNDDVQGTAGIVLAGMINAVKIKKTKLSDEKYLFLGAGSAGIGLADLLCSAMVEEGLTLEQARSRIYMFDINGLLETSRTDLVDFQKPYAHPHAPTRDFVAAIKSIKPTTIIGVSTIGGAFTQQVVEAMVQINERPVILALSNPTEHVECTPEQAYNWSNGKAIYASGVQFPPVHLNGRTFLPGQANNFYIFPAIGMAVFATQASRVTDQMFIEAARGVADQVPSDLLDQGLLYPLQSNILETETQTAARVAKLVFDSGLARVTRPDDILSFIRGHVYKPEYRPLSVPPSKAA